MTQWQQILFTHAVIHPKVGCSFLLLYCCWRQTDSRCFSSRLQLRFGCSAEQFSTNMLQHFAQFKRHFCHSQARNAIFHDKNETKTFILCSHLNLLTIQKAYLPVSYDLVLFMTSQRSDFQNLEVKKKRNGERERGGENGLLSFAGSSLTPVT